MSFTNITIYSNANIIESSSLSISNKNSNQDYSDKIKTDPGNNNMKNNNCATGGFLNVLSFIYNDQSYYNKDSYIGQHVGNMFD
jgi:hypothetical protein